jgi:hypothetical protein
MPILVRKSGSIVIASGAGQRWDIRVARLAGLKSADVPMHHGDGS